VSVSPQASTVSKFPASVAEKLGCYVYALRDPTSDDEIFYIGKGKGDRVFAHARAATKLVADIPNAKLDRIRQIHDSGAAVTIEIVRHGLTDREAFEVEAALIDILRLDDLLLNLVDGHGKARGRMSASDVLALYAAQRAPLFPSSLHAVLLRIPVLWYPAMAADDLYRATRGWWTMGERAEKAQYAFAVNRGVIREVYKVERWRNPEPGETEPHVAQTRRGFDGEPADQTMDKYRNTSVEHMFSKGSANPVRYINC